MVWLRYVLIEDVPAYEVKGWHVRSKLDCHHGHYSVLMIWTGNGEPPA
jgi:hypothetical protein